MGVIGSFWWVVVPRRRFNLRLVRETSKLSRASVAQPL